MQTVPFLHVPGSYFPKDIAGQSLCSGGATNLTISGVTPHLIQAAGRWTSEAFQAYISKNPFLLHALLFSSHPTHDHI